MLTQSRIISCKSQGKMNQSKPLVYLILLVLQFTHAKECNIQGRCHNSTLLSVANADNLKDCHTKCKTIQSCKWLTYDPVADFCFLFSDCSSIGNVQFGFQFYKNHGKICETLFTIRLHST